MKMKRVWKLAALVLTVTTLGLVIGADRPRQAVSPRLAMEMNQQGTTIPLIGDDAPAFTAETTQGPAVFPDDFKGKWVILFSHPGGLAAR